MSWWQAGLLVAGMLIVAGTVAAVIAWRRSARDRIGLCGFLREQGKDLARLPGRLRRLAADPDTPRRARWWLIGLAVYIASPIDPIPDFIPVLGYLDELVIVPLVLIHIRRMIPPAVWRRHLPARQSSQREDHSVIGTP